jgi:phosphoribosylglycinamide formyltransferase 1
MKMGSMRTEFRPLRVAVMGSTRGSSLAPILAARSQESVGWEIEVVISNRKESGILDKARAAGIEALHLPVAGRDREAYDLALTEALMLRRIDWVLLIGYMRILSDAFVTRWEGRVVNVHPSLLPKYGGMMDLDIHSAVIAAGDRESGCTLHLVSDELDGGPILIQRMVSVLPGDTPEMLKTRVQEQEGAAFLEFLGDPARFLPPSGFGG